MQVSEPILPSIIDAGSLVISRFRGFTTAIPKVGCRILPESMNIHGGLDCRQSYSLLSLPADLRVQGQVFLDGIMIDGPNVWCNFDLPETVQGAMIGRRFGEVVDHRLLRSHPMQDLRIESVALAGDGFGPIVIRLESAPFPQPDAGLTPEPLIDAEEELPF